MARYPVSPRKILSTRMVALLVICAIIFFIFSLRLLQLTVLQGDELLHKSEDNFLRRWRLTPPRGIIFDRHRKPLAENTVTFNVYFSPYRLKQKTISTTLDKLAELLSLDRDTLENNVNKLTWRGENLLVARSMPLTKITPLVEQEHNFPGVFVRETLERHYPPGEVAAHVTGYASSIPAEQLQRYLEKGYSRNDTVGIAGLELEYEDYLQGEEGYQIIVQNARGKVIDSTIEQPARQGNNLVLTLDAELQKFCWEQVKDVHAVIIVENPQNGEILAMVSTPSFKPDHPLQEIPDRETSLFNRAVQGTYAPGSTIKPLFALSFIENGIDPEQQIYCSGEYKLPNWRHPFLCNQGYGHEWVDLERAIKVSCNTYFYKYGYEMRGKTLVDAAYRFGLGRITGIDLPYEKQGYLPLYDTASLTRGRLLQFSIGQGKINITPIQMVYAYSMIASKGHAPVPHLVRRVENQKGKITHTPKHTEETVSLKSDAYRHVINGMRQAVNAPGGTAHRADFDPGWNVAGKTGTAQNPQGTNDAWFLCFSPAQHPDILILVMMEEGGHGGSTAAPIARNILEWIHEPKRKNL